MHASQAQLAAANVDRPGSSAGISVDTWDELAVLTLDGRGMICDCNYAGEALFGYLLSELVWRHVSMLLPQLAELELIQDGRPNAHLRFLCRIGQPFQAVTQNRECFTGQLFLNVLDAKGRGRLTLIVRPADKINETPNPASYDNDDAARLNVRDWEAQIPQDELETTVRAMIQQPATFESRHRRKDGTIIDVEINAKGIVLDGKSYLYASARDITERKHATSALRESEERFRNLANSAPVLVWMSDTTKLCYWLNQRWLEFTGRTMDQEMGNGWAEGVHPEDLQRCLDTYVAAFDARQEFAMEYRLRRFDGEYRWLVDKGVPRHDDQGAFIGYIGSCIDITERKQTEETLRRNEARHSSMVSNISDVIGIIGVDGFMKYKSPNIEKWFGWQPQDLVGTDGWLTVHPDDLERIQKEFVTLLERDNSVTTVEYRYRCKDGSYKLIELTATNLVNDPTIGGVLLNYYDLTERKRAEDEIRRAKDAAEAANRAKSEFLANMSHEIRTPLNGVIGNAQLLEMTEPTAEQKEYLSAIMLSGSNLLSLINDILDLSKIEAEKVVLEQADFSLRGCFNDVVRTQRSRIGNKGLSLKLQIPNEVPDALVGDELRVKQILLNLLGNAIKFTQKGGITLSAAVKEHDSRKALIELTVTDTGIGIPKAVADDIFKPFVQGDSSTTRKYGGSGLGLAISRRLAELMGGSISVESTEGAGSTFRVLLPFTVIHQVAQEQGMSAAEAPTAPWAGAPLKVLLVEDNAINWQFGIALLKKMGHAVTLAENGMEALAALEAEAFDLVLMDIQMPVMDGQEALAVLRERERGAGAHVPVIALTAHALKGQEAKFLAAGFDGYVSKPLEVKKLVEEMKRVLDLQPVVEPG